MWPGALAHFAPAVWIGLLVNGGHACCPCLQKRGVNKSSFVNAHARSPSRLWSPKMSSNLSLFHCNNVFKALSIFPNSIFIKNINRAPKTKGAIQSNCRCLSSVLSAGSWNCWKALGFHSSRSGLWVFGRERGGRRRSIGRRKRGKKENPGVDRLFWGWSTPIAKFLG